MGLPELTPFSVSLIDVEVEANGIVLLASTSVELAAGEIVAVTGPSGSGKTTLLNCAAGVIVPSSGSVRIGEIVISDLRESRRARFRRKDLGLVFQEPELLDELDVQENVALPLIFNGVRRRDTHRPVAQALDKVGLTDLATASVSTLSGGEAQRVSIARALVKGPRLIVADEPTAALDAQNALRIVELLVTQARRAGAALLVATHDDQVASRCDRVLSLRQSATARL